MKAVGVKEGLEMTSNTVLSTCDEAGMIPLCAQDAPGDECFLQGRNLIKAMEDSNCGQTSFWKNKDCFFLNYVFAYRKDKTPKVLKVENSTVKAGEISWQNIVGDVGFSGQNRKNFYALCQYVLPTTTTTTTTTTEAPTTLSRDEMEQHLTKTECPLNENTEEQNDSSSETRRGLPQIDLFLNPERKRELEELKLWVAKNEENLTYTEVKTCIAPTSLVVICIPPQDVLSRIYPNIFQLLWHSMPPCFPNDDNPDSPYLLSRCSWLGNDVNCSDVFTQVITDSGVCCAFNMQEDNLKDSEYSALVQAMREPKSENKDDKVRKVTSGVGRGLQVLLDQNSHRSFFFAQ